MSAFGGVGATPENAIRVPSDMYALADARLQRNAYSNVWYGQTDLGPYSWDLPTEPPELKVDPHLNGRNITFCDGHAESVKRSQLISRSFLWAKRWYSDNQPHPEDWSRYAIK